MSLALRKESAGSLPTDRRTLLFTPFRDGLIELGSLRCSQDPVAEAGPE